MLTNQTVERLHQLRLHGMAQAFNTQIQDPDIKSLSFEERFSIIIDQEWLSRQNRRLSRLLREAKLRLAACMEDLDYSQPRDLNRSLMRSLANCEWISSHQNILVIGPTGVGKTFIACALANAACRLNFSTRYFRVPRLCSELAIAKGDGSYHRFLNKLAKVDLLVFDDWGIAPFTPDECRNLLEILDDRSGTRSTVFASQLPVDLWHGIMADPTIADAILDRVVHNAHKIILKGESMRKIKSGLSHDLDSDKLDSSN